MDLYANSVSSRQHRQKETIRYPSLIHVFLNPESGSTDDAHTLRLLCTRSQTQPIRPCQVPSDVHRYMGLIWRHLLPRCSCLRQHLFQKRVWKAVERGLEERQKHANERRACIGSSQSLKGCANGKKRQLRSVRGLSAEGGSWQIPRMVKTTRGLQHLTTKSEKRWHAHVRYRAPAKKSKLQNICRDAFLESEKHSRLSPL